MKRKKRWFAAALALVMTALSACGSADTKNPGGTPGRSLEDKTNQTENTAGGGVENGAPEGGIGDSGKRKTYEPVFVSSGTEADAYNEKLDRFVEEFISYMEETGQADKMTGYEEPIEVISVNWYDASDEDGISKIGAKTGETLTYNRWNDAIKRLFNVDLTYSWQSQNTDFTQKLRLDMASGELPDIFLVQEQSDLIQMAEQGLIWDMTDLIDEYASERDKEVWKSDEGGNLKKVTIDGRVYAIPSSVSATDHVSYIWFRDDWMEKLNLEYPKTVEELEKVAEAFVTQDPDGNGKDDTWGIQLPNDPVTGVAVRGLYAGFGAYPEYWVKQEDGSVVYGGVTEGTKNALAYLADLYQKGCINPEFVTLDNTKITEEVLNNQVGILYGGHWFGHTAGDLHELNPDARWKCVPLPSKSGKAAKSIMRPNNTGWLVVNKNFEHPELALKLRALCTFGVMSSDSAWWWYDENIMWHLSPCRSGVSAFDNLITYQNLQEAYEHNSDESLLKAKAVPYWANLHGKDGWEWELMFGPGDHTPMHVLEQDYEQGNLFWDPYNGVPSEFMQERWSSIMDEQKRFYSNIIIGKLGVEEGFNQWLDTFNNLGGEQITGEVNDWCQEHID